MQVYTIQPDSYEKSCGCCHSSYEWHMTSLDDALLQKCYPNSILRSLTIEEPVQIENFKKWGIVKIKEDYRRNYPVFNKVPLSEFFMSIKNKEEYIRRNGLLIMYLNSENEAHSSYEAYDACVKIALEQNPESIMYVPKSYLTRDFIKSFIEDEERIERLEISINGKYHEIDDEWENSDLDRLFHRSHVYKYIFQNIAHEDDEFYNYVYKTIKHPPDSGEELLWDRDIQERDYLNYVDLSRISH